MIKQLILFVGNIRKLFFVFNEQSLWLNFIILFKTTIIPKNKRNYKKLYYLTNGHNRLATETIKAFCYEMNIFTVCSVFWKVKRVLSCVVFIVEFTVLVSVLLLTVLVPSLPQPKE